MMNDEMPNDEIVKWGAVVRRTGKKDPKDQRDPKDPKGPKGHGRQRDAC